MTLSPYLPQDRLRALARGETLPDRTSGSALFADISGFTALTEGLRDFLGPRRGAEELTKHLETVYSALITQIEIYGGSVITLAGDAILCWFDDAHGTAASRATAAAFALQQAMRAFAAIALPNGATIALTVKVAIATGPARRFVVGDPEIQRLDALAGATITRTSTAEQHAQKGDVLLDEASVNALGEALTLAEWRTDGNGERFAVATKYSSDTVSRTLPATMHPPSASKLMTWLHHAVYEREESGQESFMSEFRPCVALFARFVGIDYDADEAQAQLDAFVKHAQTIAGRYDGTFMDLTIGDKGSYAYVNFGALSAHEDEARRAVNAAFDLKRAMHELNFLAPLQIGIAQGMLRVGAYGGKTRKTFGALGDDVNLAARLMMAAAPGEILLSSRVHQAVEPHFVFEPRAPLPMKGKVEPLPVFVVTGARQERAIRLQEPRYALPMVGRDRVLQIIHDKLDLVLQGRSQVIGIVAEAGMGKSRLVAEVIRAAHKKGFAGYGGACQSDAVNTPYLAWKAIWSAFFAVDPDQPLRKKLRALEGEIQDRAPGRVQAMPLLGVLLNLEIPENDFTETLEPPYRKSALTALLEDCLRAAAQEEPLLIVIEDLHWIDALSLDLLQDLARLLGDSRVCFVLAYRPLQFGRLEPPQLEGMPNFSKIELHELNAAEAEQAIRAKLAQLYPARRGIVPGGLVDKLMARAQGNPFYLEELLNYVRDRGLDPSDLNKIELPESLHTLILSRIDQLSEHEKTTLRVASIVGRLFRAGWLTGYYPDVGSPHDVRRDLDRLAEMDLTPLDSPEPELAYLFKHIVTHEVTYESLPFATRARLHEQLAIYLERQIASGGLTESFLLDTLVHHYERSDNHVKQREYLGKGAKAAQEVGAYKTAVEYLSRLVKLTPAADPARSALTLELAEAHLRSGDYINARAHIAQAQAGAATDTDRALAQAMLGELMYNLGEYSEAQTILLQAVSLAHVSGDSPTRSRALGTLGVNYLSLSKVDEARVALNESLVLARALGDVPRELEPLAGLGLAYLKIDLAESERLFKQVYTRAVAVGNRFIAMAALNNLGVVADRRKDIITAQEYVRQSLALAREIGAQQSISLYLINLAQGDMELGQLALARAELREGMAVASRIGLLPMLVAGVMTAALLAHTDGESERALLLLGLARSHPAWNSYHQHEMDKWLAEWALDAAVVEEGLAKGVALDWEETVRELIKGGR